MNRRELKKGIISIGLGLIISAPISHMAMESWENPPRVEAKSLPQDVSGLQIDIKAEAEAIVNRAILEQAELERQQNIDADAINTLEIYEVEVPDEIITYCEAAQEESNVCAELLEAVCWRESRFDPRATNNGCEGIAQISTKWHSGRMKKLGVTDIYDAEGNIRVAADYLHELFQKHDGDTYKVLMEYNGDTSTGISNYALDICAVSEALERVHGK